MKTYLNEKMTFRATEAKPTSNTEKIINFFKKIKKISIPAKKMELNPEQTNVAIYNIDRVLATNNEKKEERG